MSVTVIVSSSAPTSPPPTITTAPNGICSGNGSTVACDAVSGAIFYSWSAPAGTTFDGGNPSPYITSSNSVQVTFGTLPPGVTGYDICVFAGNGCGTSVTKCRYIRGRVQQPQTINGLANPCPNTSSVYSITSQVGANSYTWTVTGTANINDAGTTVTTTGTSVTVNFLSGWTSGTLSVYASMSCSYNSPVRMINIVSTPPVPGVIFGSAFACPFQTSAYSIAPVSGATGYIWSSNVPGAVVTPSGTSVSILYPGAIPSGAQVSVIATGTCGNSTPRIKNIGTGVSNPPGTISGSTAGQCSQSGVSYSILPVGGASSYLWSISAGASVSGPANLSAVSIDFGSSFTTVILSVIAVNSCGNSAPQTLVITGGPAQPGIISGNQAVCFESVEHYSTPGSAGAISYNWTAPSGATIFGAPVLIPEIDVYWGMTSGNISVNAENSCGISISRDLPVSVVCRQSQVMETNMDISLYPNPVTEKATLSFNSSNDENYFLSLTDLTGRKVMKRAGQTKIGINFIEIDFSTYAKGVYTLDFNISEGNKQIKIVVE